MPISKQLDYGTSGDDVKQLQQFLISKGYQIQAGATGYFGSQTQEALKKFQIIKLMLLVELDLLRLI